VENVERQEIQAKLFKRRYRLRQNLGSQGLAELYLADDLLFQRTVLVEVVYPDVAADAAYRERFETEARLAAGLDHPNITRTIDWGYEDGLYFLVSEYIEGRSLEEILRADGKLPSSRAARIAAEVCGALQLAHSRNLVHGGLSPQVITVDAAGQVKVMDFGMAWAASGRGYTQYISPEQIQRLTIDGRSDLYSLGIILYQMLTGRVPFDSADLRAVAYRQLNEVAPSPSVIDPAIPASLSAITMKAIAKNPGSRYRGAEEMRAALLQYLEGRPQQETVYVEKREPIPPWLWGVITAIALIAIAGIILAILLTRGTQVAVPNIIGLNETQAEQAVQQDGLTFKTQDQYITSPSQQVGVVVDQNPAAGTRLNKGLTVTATVTRALSVPDVTGQSQTNAENTLRAHGINNIQETNVPVSDPTQVGNVVQQTPAAGTLITPDTIVVLQIGQQSSLIVVPNVVDLDQNTAIQQLQTAGLRVSVVQQQSTTVPRGRVISQSPAAGQQVNRDSTVSIVVSSGPPAPAPSPPGVSG
jgi:serine/threonine-protein kinase